MCTGLKKKNTGLKKIIMVRKSTRRRRARFAKYRCEFIYNPVVYPKLSRKIRCTNLYDLHAHHITYARFGKEHINDLIMLCPKHHAVAHLRMMICSRCGKKLLNSDYKAEKYWIERTGLENWGMTLTHAKDRLFTVCQKCLGEK